MLFILIQYTSTHSLSYLISCIFILIHTALKTQSESNTLTGLARGRLSSTAFTLFLLHRVVPAIYFCAIRATVHASLVPSREFGLKAVAVLFQFLLWILHSLLVSNYYRWTLNENDNNSKVYQIISNINGVRSYSIRSHPSAPCLPRLPGSDWDWPRLIWASLQHLHSLRTQSY